MLICNHIVVHFHFSEIFVDFSCELNFANDNCRDILDGLNFTDVKPYGILHGLDFVQITKIKKISETESQK